MLYIIYIYRVLVCRIVCRYNELSWVEFWVSFWLEISCCCWLVSWLVGWLVGREVRNNIVHINRICNLVVSTESIVSLLPVSAGIDLLKKSLARLSNLALTSGDFSECSDWSELSCSELADRLLQIEAREK